MATAYIVCSPSEGELCCAILEWVERAQHEPYLIARQTIQCKLCQM